MDTRSKRPIRYQAPSEGNAPLSVCLGFDFDTMAVWPTAFDMHSTSALSRGEFGAAVGIHRVLDLLARQAIPATFYVPAFTALTYPHLVQRIANEGHEIASHGWMHEVASDYSQDEMAYVVDRAIEDLDRVTGVRPVGYRTVGGDMGPHLVELLIDRGYEYESTLCANDFYPWFVRTGDEYSPQLPYVFGTPTALVAVPFSYTLDDFPNFEFVPGWAAAMRTPSEVAAVWQAEFDFAVREAPGGIFTNCLHPQVIGRGSRIRMLEQLLDHMKSESSVRFERVRDYAARWRAVREDGQSMAAGT